jgi:signal transduction histidine kinase
MKLFTKGLLLIAVPSVVELALLGVLFKTQGQTTQAALWAANSKQILYQASAIMDPLLRQASRLRAGIIVGDASFIDKHAIWVDLNDRMSQLERLVADNPLQVDRVHRMRQAIDTYRAQTLAVAQSLHDGRRPVMLAVFQGTPLPAQVEVFREQLDALLTEESRLDAERSASLSATRERQRFALGAAVAGSMLMWALAALVFARNIGRRLLVLTGNAERLGRGQAFGKPLSGGDEIARLDAVLHQTGARLRAAVYEQAALKTKLEARATELTHVNEDLRQQTQDNEMFIYSVSHDLRSPLVNLQGFSKELQVSCDELRATLAAARLPVPERTRLARVLDGDLAESLHFLRTAVARSAAIIDALSRLSRAGRLEYQWQRVSVARAVAHVVHAMQAPIRERDALVIVRDLPPAWGDPTAVEQIFSHLIGNAVNFLDPARPGRIEVGSLEHETAEVMEPPVPRMRTYYVRDNGLGIPAAYMPKVFSAFQRLHGDVAKGDGIGLALVRRMIERHGGRVWVESTEGGGTTFFVSLPEQPIRMAP